MDRPVAERRARTPREVVAPEVVEIEESRGGPLASAFAALAAAGRWARRRLGTRRGRREAAILAVIAGLLLCLAFDVLAPLRRIVHRQPEYAWTLDHLVFDPPPPDYLLSGREGMIRDARRVLGPYEGRSLLDLDLAELGDVLSHESPWVRRVLKIEAAYPNRVVVTIEYRQPVAIAFVPAPRRTGQTARRNASYPIDADGVILPANEIAPDLLKGLIQVYGLDPPYDANPGRDWNQASSTPGLSVADPRAVVAARLAVFLSKQEPLPTLDGRPFRVVGVDVKELPAFIIGDTRTWVLWGPAPGDETAGEPDATQRWAMLADWLKQHSTAEVRHPDHLKITPQGVVVQLAARKS